MPLKIKLLFCHNQQFAFFNVRGIGILAKLSILIYRLFHEIANSVERNGVFDGHFGERFAVKDDVCFFQSENELAVTESPHSGGSVDSRDPESPKITFSDPTVPGGISIRPNDRLFDGAEEFSPSAAKPFGPLE